MKPILTVLLVAFTSIAFSQTSETLDGTPEGQFVSVKLVEVTGNSFWQSTIIVSDGTKILKALKLSAVNPKNIGSDLVKITAILNEVEAQGYELVSSSSGSVDAAQMTNFTFQKKK